ncbi:hypothetical protein FNV43_RR14407 [Rhamnella rubrinervis]|uniref:Hexosyltransferase n=1 Tax=Rhamnella rubrinervis TaxID=2594499 RepID=A0A8K0H315_9ROSA|nr:hypothetical protein FNV43_RR14407 [Rhamnella rubrinervis]
MFIFRLVFVTIINIISLLIFPTDAIRSFPAENGLDLSLEFSKAPDYRNGVKCPSSANNHGVGLTSGCNPSLVHIAMTIDSEYLRGSMAAVHSVLKHTSCPDNIFFHFIVSDSGSVNPDDLTRTISSTFPLLSFRAYVFRENIVRDLISSSIRQALDNPLNYARSYLADLLDPCVKRVIYLDSDILVIDDIQKLWEVSLTGSRVIGAPEYCRANFTKYFSAEFWSDAELAEVFAGKTPCYFNTGVMVMDLVRWREGDYTRKIENWMEIQKERRIYELGSLPPFLLVFGGDVEGIDHRWNQHGLGGDNVVNSCRTVHPGPVSLLHWSGKGKPWARLDSGAPCQVDFLWAPYDLYKPHNHHQQKRRQII